MGVCVECDLYRDKRVDQRGPQRTEQSGSGYILLCGPTNVRCGGRYLVGIRLEEIAGRGMWACKGDGDIREGLGQTETIFAYPKYS